MMIRGQINGSQRERAPLSAGGRSHTLTPTFQLPASNGGQNIDASSKVRNENFIAGFYRQFIGNAYVNQA